jgi:hypothetical protein
MRQYRRHAGKMKHFDIPLASTNNRSAIPIRAFFVDVCVKDLELTLPSHANAHCIMKILKGSLVETRFKAPTAVDINNGQQRLMEKIGCEKMYSENEVTYMADNLGVHRISNPDPTEYAVSLHCKFLKSVCICKAWLTPCSVHTA